MLRKHKKDNPYVNVLFKTVFPGMLKELWNILNGPRLLPPAFEKCGLVPLNPARAMERIPDKATSAAIAFGQCFGE